MPAGSENGLEKRGHLTSNGKKELWVLRRGVLRIYEDTQKRPRAHVGNVMLGYRCEVRLHQKDTLEISSHLPFDCEYAYRASSAAEAEAWQAALQTNLEELRRRMQGFLHFLDKGCTAYKYNYSNSKRMRRHFWINEATVELCWGKSRKDEPQTMELKDCVGIIYGPMTTTFQRSNALEDPPWCCFSLLFPDRTLDLAVPEEHTEAWFLGLQDLLITRADSVMSTLTEPSFAFKKAYLKLRDSAHRQGYTTRIYLVRQLRALGRNKAFRESFKHCNTTKVSSVATPAKNASVTDAEAEAKAERRRRRKEKEAKATEATEAQAAGDAGASRVKRSPRPQKAQNGSSAALHGNSEHQEEELRKMIAQLEGDLDAQTSRLEGLRPKWSAQLGAIIPMDDLQEVLRGEAKWEWQYEKCTELEREVLTLKCTNSSMTRQLQVAEKSEKQLKKLAKQYKDAESQCANMEQELGSAQVAEKGSEKAKHNSKDSVERTEAQRKQLEAREHELKQQLQEAEKSGQELGATLKAQNKQQEQELARIEKETEDFKRKHETLAKDLKSIERRHSDNEQRLAATEGLSRNLVSSLQTLHKEVGKLRHTQKEARSDCDTQLRYITDRFPILKERIGNMMQEIEHLEEKHREIGEERKKLHNLVLELKGNIRVFVRVRPLWEREKALETSDTPTTSFSEDSKVAIWSEEQARKKWFEFDACFTPKSTNEGVFEEVKALATSVLDGYNVCIFAYGQTGSGKTYTMGGVPTDPGLNVRTLRELFKIKQQRSRDVECKLSIMVSEIYNEMIKDLLGGKTTMSKKLDVKQNSDGTATVPGLTEIPVDTVEEVLKCMEDAQANRTVMQTDMNDESSRSHSIVQVKTVCKHFKDKKELTGKINLIDLAGSENTNKSGVTGQGMKEAQNINKSLSALGDVISSLVSKSSHIPYRNSKLTMMLKDSLGGDSKTLMIVQASPAQCNVTETLSSLNFASRARNVELGKAKKNVKSTE